MRKTIGVLLTTLTFTAPAYVAIAFTVMEFNPLIWHPLFRAFMAIWAIIIAGLAVREYDKLKNDE